MTALRHQRQSFRTPIELGVSIAHYYGDLVRQIMLGAATIMLVGAPFYADDFSVQMPFIVFGAIIYIGVAALLNPWKSWVMGAAAALAGAGVVIYELWALWFFDADEPVRFVLREVPAILLLFAFYFAMKTYRAMMMDMVGRQPDPAIRGKTPRAEQAYVPAEVDESDFEQPGLDGFGRTAAPEIDKGGD